VPGRLAAAAGTAGAASFLPCRRGCGFRAGLSRAGPSCGGGRNGGGELGRGTPGAASFLSRRRGCGFKGGAVPCRAVLRRYPPAGTEGGDSAADGGGGELGPEKTGGRLFLTVQARLRFGGAGLSRAGPSCGGGGGGELGAGRLAAAGGGNWGRRRPGAASFAVQGRLRF
jgi:hypothetical protein